MGRATRRCRSAPWVGWKGRWLAAGWEEHPACGGPPAALRPKSSLHRNSLPRRWLPGAPVAVYAEGAKRMSEGISRIGIISLVSAADTAAPLAPPGLGLRGDPGAALAGAGGGDAQQARPKTGMSASALELAAAPYAGPLTETAANNQKLLLLAAFLQVRRAMSLLPHFVSSKPRRCRLPLPGHRLDWAGHTWPRGHRVVAPALPFRVQPFLPLAATCPPVLRCPLPCLRLATGTTRSSSCDG